MMPPWVLVKPTWPPFHCLKTNMATVMSCENARFYKNQRIRGGGEINATALAVLRFSFTR